MWVDIAVVESLPSCVLLLGSIDWIRNIHLWMTDPGAGLEQIANSNSKIAVRQHKVKLKGKINHGLVALAFLCHFVSQCWWIYPRNGMLFKCNASHISYMIQHYSWIGPFETQTAKYVHGCNAIMLLSTYVSFTSLWVSEHREFNYQISHNHRQLKKMRQANLLCLKCNTERWLNTASICIG